MTFAEFIASTETDSLPPSRLPQALAALWHDRRGNWDVAHNLAQSAGGKDGAWVHAYLHRKEGDGGNAAYWYRIAGRPSAAISLAEEWENITKMLLSEIKSGK